MSGFPDYDRHDAVGLAELVRRKEVSAAELLSEALSRCDSLNRQLNAVIYRRDFEAARVAAAIDPELPLAGVPFLVKDIGPALAGAPLTSGSRLFSNFVPDEDGEIVRRFKDAGLVVFGKTSVPEFGLLPVTEPELFGPCRNPWDLARTPGGSSGGAAASVSAGIVPMAHGSDGGGSIRIPASCCGLFGLKPSRGLNPGSTAGETITEDFVADHVLTRSVRDSAAVLDLVSNQRNGGFLLGLDAEAPRLRVAVARGAMMGSTVSAESRAALEEAAKLLADLGHVVTGAEPKVDYAEIAMAYLTFCAVGTMQTLTNAARLRGKPARRRDVELATWTLGKVGSIISDEDLTRARTVIWRTAKAFKNFLDTHDVLVSPVLATPPLLIGESASGFGERLVMRLFGALKSPFLLKTLLRKVARRNFEFAAFTAPFNITGQPAMSVPLHWTGDGLPIGIQIAGSLGSDALLLRLARQLELARPWAARRPHLAPPAAPEMQPAGETGQVAGLTL